MIAAGTNGDYRGFAAWVVQERLDGKVRSDHYLDGNQLNARPVALVKSGAWQKRGPACGHVALRCDDCEQRCRETFERLDR